MVATETIGQRLKIFRKSLQKSQAELAAILEVEQALVSMVENNKTELAYWHIRKLKEVFNLNADWLEYGKGKMLLPAGGNNLVHEPATEYVSRTTHQSTDVKILTIAVDRFNNEVVKAVPAFAQAGYQKGYGDPEFIGSLPDYDFYSENDGTYRVFELKGDSMFPYLQEGDFVKAKYLPSIHWSNKLRANEIFIIVGKDGIVCKQLRDHNIETGDMHLHSFNDLYEDYTINLADVYELWYYKGFYSRRSLRDLK